MLCYVHGLFGRGTTIRPSFSLLELQSCTDGVECLAQGTVCSFCCLLLTHTTRCEARFAPFHVQSGRQADSQSVKGDRLSDRLSEGLPEDEP